MNRWMKTVLAVALVVGAVAITRTAASADDGADRQYADAMWYFVPVMGRFATDLDLALAAAEVKPETAADLAALAFRGEYMVYDLEGTPVPASMANAHERLLAGLRQLNEAAQIGAEDHQGARLLFDTYEPMLSDSRHEIRSWLMTRTGIGTPIESPAAIAGQ